MGLALPPVYSQLILVSLTRLADLRGFTWEYDYREQLLSLL